MSLTVGSPLAAPLAAPVDSQTANPIEFIVPPTGVPIRIPDFEVEAIELRAPNSPFRGRKVLDPQQVEAQQYATDERAGILSQASTLAEEAPSSAVAWARYAQALMSADEVDRAVDAAAKTLHLASRVDPLEPGDMPIRAAQFVAARVLAAAGHDADAETALSDLPGDGPWRVLYAALAVRRGEHRQALARLGDGKSSETLALRGFLLLLIDRPQQAIAELRAAQRSGGSAPGLLLNLAYAYAVVGAPLKAIRAARQAVVLSPDSRHASFNLASYLRAAGFVSEALDELRRLRAVIGDRDPQAAAAIADAYVACGDTRQALRELRRAQHHNTFEQGSTRFAELAANTALLEWTVGDRDRPGVLKVIREQLKVAGPHLPLVVMLADVIGDTRGVHEVEAAYRRLQETLSDEQLGLLAARVEILRGDLESAARTAMAYAKANPLDSNAVAGAISLAGQILGDYDSAAEMGMDALRRMPADRMLINNVAFCLAHAGRAKEADNLLSRQSLDNAFLLATRGLVDFGLGRVAEGLARYDEAARLIAASAVNDADEIADFERYLRTHETLALYRLGLAAHPDMPSELLTIRVPVDWQHDPRYVVLRPVARRLGISWATAPGV